jgi:hypothetical protein
MTLEFFSKKRMFARHSALDQRRSPHIKDWRKITEVIRPSRGIYLDGGGDNAETSRRPTSMINSTPHVASRTLQAGMISGASSPSYEWFKFFLDDPELMKWGPARIALEQREKICNQYLARSNFYQQLQTAYGDAADFGTGAGIIDLHPRDIFTAKVFAPGEYFIDVDETGDIDTLYRDTPRTVLQIVGKWGLEKVTQKVKDAYSKGDYNTPFHVMEVIEPNQDLTEGREDWRGKPWVKFVFLKDNKDEGEANYLEISGYDEWPGFNLRWDIASGNTWGQGPGLIALGDAAALQTLEFRDAQAVEKAGKPPMGAPVHLRNKPISHAPGGVTYYDPFTANNAKVEPLYQIQAGILQAYDNKIARTEFRINEVYYKDLFLMLASSDRREITAREVEEKHQEKLWALGPVLQRTHRDALSNSIIRIYRVIEAAGLFPPAPQELQGRLIGIKYTSALAFAQRAAGAASLERFFGFTGNIIAAYPQVKHKINMNKGMDHYADAIGVPAEIMLSDDEANKSAQAEAQAAQGPAQATAVKDMAAGAQLLSETDTTRPSALSFLMNRAGVAA